MMMNKFSASILLVLTFFISCTKEDAVIDEEKPTITVQYDGGFPQSCTALVKGETYHFRVKVTDNVALASYSLDIHNNFDHHTHDDQGAQCDLSSIKQAINPMIYMESFTIEDSPTSYEIEISLLIPSDVDAGDYHCAYAVIDETGWQSRTSIDIKIVE